MERAGGGFAPGAGGRARNQLDRKGSGARRRLAGGAMLLTARAHHQLAVQGTRPHFPCLRACARAGSLFAGSRRLPAHSGRRRSDVGGYARDPARSRGLRANPQDARRGPRPSAPPPARPRDPALALISKPAGRFRGEPAAAAERAMAALEKYRVTQVRIAKTWRLSARLKLRP